jgi:25S rRNA (cytosine2278-C5)-methyltransferase
MIQPIHSFFANNTEVASIPRWVRVNTLKTSYNKIIAKLSSLSSSLVRVNELTTLQTCTQNSYFIDPHIPNLIAFNRSYPLTTTTFAKEYSSGQIILQDKASCIPGSLLAVSEGETVLDACAAPGNKTTLLAAGLGTRGHVFAVEKDEKRVVTLKNMVEKAGATKCMLP